MVEFYILQVTLLPYLVVTDAVEEGTCHATSRDFVIRELLGIMGEFSSSKVTTLKVFVIIGFLKEGIFSFHFLNTLSQVTRCHGLM